MGIFKRNMVDPLIEQILNRVKTIDSRLDSIEKQVSFIGTEREILEDVRVGQASLKELLLNHRTHLDNTVGDIKSEVIEQALKTEEKIDENIEKTEETKDKINEVKQAITK